MAAHLRALRALGSVTLVVPKLSCRAALIPQDVVVLTRGRTTAEALKERQEAPQSRLLRAWASWRRRNMIDARANPDDLTRFRGELSGRFDLVFAGRLGNAVWWESIAGSAPNDGEMRIVDFDDIESGMLETHNATIKASWFWTWKLRREVVWLRQLERRIAKSWDAVIICSKIDCERLQKITGERAWIVPNGYDFIDFCEEKNSDIISLLFVGSFEYFPNSQGILWFFESIWPIVRRELNKKVEITLVGRNATPEILALSVQPGISVASDVVSVDPYYAAANIVIAPLLSGSGTRIKLIEAAAKGRAIVTTSIGSEGLDFADGVEADIANQPAAFAARIIALARDPALRARRSRAARAHAERAFSSDAIARDLQDRIRSNQRLA